MAMAEWLLLRLGREADQPSTWVIADARGQLLAVPSDAMGEQLTTAAAGRRVALVVPGSDVLQLSATLPTGNDSKLQQIVPFALEDQVSQDVDDLHFALGTRDSASGLTPVAVVAKSLMAVWLERATQMQLQPQAIYADSELAPELPGHLTALLEDQQMVLKRGGRPMVLPATDPKQALEMFLGMDMNLAAEDLVVYATSVDWKRHSIAIEALRDQLASLKVQLSSAGVLALLTPGLANPSLINLLQGAFRPKANQAATWRRWRIAAALAGGLLLLHGVGQWLELRRLNASERSVDDAIAQVVQTAMPGDQNTGGARQRMEQRLKAVASGQGQRGELMSLLAAVAAAHQNVPIAKIESMSFKSGTLDMRVTAPDATTLEQLSQALRASGYSAEVTSGNVRGNTYEGRVNLRSGV
jgi:general secretion pathway protein L